MSHCICGHPEEAHLFGGRYGRGLLCARDEALTDESSGAAVAGARRSIRLDSRQPSSTEVSMRLIGLAVVPAVAFKLVPPGVEAS